MAVAGVGVGGILEKFSNVEVGLGMSDGVARVRDCEATDRVVLG